MSSSCSHQRMLRLGALLSLSIVGCAPPSATHGTTRPAGHVTEIPQAEIETGSTRYVTAYDIVRALRPAMLVSRSITTSRQSRSRMWEAEGGVKVYLDGMRYGGVESLAMIPANTVREVRWLSPMDATTLYGTGNVGGAIVVITRNGRQR